MSLTIMNYDNGYEYPFGYACIVLCLSPALCLCLCYNTMTITLAMTMTYYTKWLLLGVNYGNMTVTV